MLNKILMIVTMTLLCFSSVWAATCHSERLVSSTPTSRFISTDITVTDTQTTLLWMRCAVGQEWIDNTCKGKAQTLDWQHAMAIVDKVNAEGLGGYHDWRMPMVPELASIVERQCFNPRMNIEVFPGPPSKVFWSSMEKMGTKNFAYTLDFGGGAAMASNKEKLGAVRLVRGGPWWQPPAVMSQR